MPPILLDAVDATPLSKKWKDRSRPTEPNLAGLRDRALLLVCFVAALRRSELVAADIDHLREHPNGVTLAIPRSKTNQTGAHPELVVLPRSANPEHYPVTALQAWLTAAGLNEGPIFRAVSKGNRVLDRRLVGKAVNMLIQTAVRRAGIDADGYSAHSLRAGFITYANSRGAPDRAIAHQSRHRSMAGLGGYIRYQTAWTDNAATSLGL